MIHFLYPVFYLFFLFIYGLLLAPLLTIVILLAYYLIHLVITLLGTISYPQHLVLRKKLT
jgi:hypothetical protein